MRHVLCSLLSRCLFCPWRGRIVGVGNLILQKVHSPDTAGTQPTDRWVTVIAYAGLDVPVGMNFGRAEKDLCLWKHGWQTHTGPSKLLTVESQIYPNKIRRQRENTSQEPVPVIIDRRLFLHVLICITANHFSTLCYYVIIWPARRTPDSQHSFVGQKWEKTSNCAPRRGYHLEITLILQREKKI